MRRLLLLRTPAWEAIENLSQLGLCSEIAMGRRQLPHVIQAPWTYEAPFLKASTDAATYSESSSVRLAESLKNAVTPLAAIHLWSECQALNI
jgi:hypothetical protein